MFVTPSIAVLRNAFSFCPTPVLALTAGFGGTAVAMTMTGEIAGAGAMALNYFTMS
jgi:hypothetical protein